MPRKMKEMMHEHEIEIDDDTGERTEKRRVRARFIDEDGNEQDIDWEGSGEMPEDI